LSGILKAKGVNASIIPIEGSAEIAPSLNLADAICDLTQTGKTLRENKLIPIFTILESEAVLIESPVTKEEKEEFLRLQRSEGAV
jgi:ATP phosphoribosyltransferase